MMSQRVRAVVVAVAVAGAFPAVHGLQGSRVSAASVYKAVQGWGQLPAPLKWGEVPNVAIDPKGTVFVFTRTEPPVVELTQAGKLVKTWGQGMFVWPHGIRFDRDGNLWITDGRAEKGNGQMVYKMSTDGSKVLMTLGTRGVSGDGPNQFNGVTDVAIAPNGDIFVAEGHSSGPGSTARLYKFSKDGTLIKTWGSLGKGDGADEYDQPHALAMDSRGRLFVGDRGNNRIKILDQDGKLLDTWYQFSRPSGVFIDAQDNIYVADSESQSVGSGKLRTWKRGIRVGSAKDGSIRAFIPDPVDVATNTSSAEGVTVDSRGVIYGAEVGPTNYGPDVPPHSLKRYVKR